MLQEVTMCKIFCDGCHAFGGYVEIPGSTMHLIKEMKLERQGWHVIDGLLHYCPTCCDARPPVPEDSEAVTV